MPHDLRVDAYIDRSAEFARPILRHFRELVRGAAPDAAETIKWGMPFFTLDGKALAMMAAFKAHAGIGIFDGAPMSESDGMGQFGRLATCADLPDDAVLLAAIGTALARVAAGAPTMRTATTRPAPEMPADLRKALDAVPAAAAAFDGFPPSARRDYIEWVVAAKQAATRERRIVTTVAQCAEGKRL